MGDSEIRLLRSTSPRGKRRVVPGQTLLASVSALASLTLPAAAAPVTVFQQPQDQAIRKEAGLMVPMRDGVRLSTDLYFPADAAAPFSTVLCRASHSGPNTVFGIRVIGDKLGRWVNTRPIWNQHAYSVTHVDNAGRVTKTSEWVRNWDDPMLNNFRQNSPGEGAGAGLMPDLTIRQAKVNCADDGAEIAIEVCNRGTEPVADGIPVSVHDGTSSVCTTPSPSPWS